MEQKLIDKLVSATELEKGQIVLLNFWGEEEEIEDLYHFINAVSATGAMPMSLIHSSKYYQNLFENMQSEVPEKWFEQFAGVEIVVDIMNHTPGMPPKGLAAEKIPLFGAYLRKLFQAFSDKKKLIQITMPTDANAVLADIEPEVFKARTLKALDVDYRKLKEDCQSKIESFAGTTRTIVTGKDCILALDTTDRKWIVDAGDGALPAGEIYIAPVEEHSNGNIFFETLAVEGRGVFSNVTVTVKQGQMTGSDCEEFNAFLKELPEGGNVVAELGIGMNPNVDKILGDSHLDENAVGTFHIGIGMNHLFGGKNETPVHFDFVAEGVVK